MKNIWVGRRRLRILFPVDSRVMVTGPFYRDWGLNKRDYVGEEGIVKEYSVKNGWVGVILDIHTTYPFNNLVWFYPNEIRRTYVHTKF